MGRGKFKGKPTGHRHFSTPGELRAGTSTRPRTFRKVEELVAKEKELQEGMMMKHFTIVEGHEKKSTGKGYRERGGFAATEKIHK